MINKNEVNKKNETKNNNKSSGLRIDDDVKLLIEKELSQLKKKKTGSGRINPSHILRLLIPKLTNEDREEILSQTVTGDDRERAAFSAYSKKHKGSKKSDFKDLLLYGEINIDDYLPPEMRRKKMGIEINNIKSS